MNNTVVMLVEDDDGDALLVKEALGDDATLMRAVDAETAWHLLDEIRQGSRPAPHFVLLDLNLPGVRGVEVLRRMKADPRLRSIPVTVLSTSSAPADIASVYEAHGNAYVVKSVRLDDFMSSIERVRSFWMDTVVTR